MGAVAFCTATNTHIMSNFDAVVLTKGVSVKDKRSFTWNCGAQPRMGATAGARAAPVRARDQECVLVYNAEFGIVSQR